MPRSYTPPGHRPPTSGPSGSPLTLAVFAAVATAVAVVGPSVLLATVAVVLVAAAVAPTLRAGVALVRDRGVPHSATVSLPRSNLRLEVALSRRE
jgi:hypothetical protein